jgi:hypothetical protein
MKLSDITTKLTSLKSRTKIIAATALVAGAFTLAAPAAQAQRVYFGIHVGPRHVAPVPVYHPYYGYDHHPYWHHDYRYDHRR